MPLVWLLSSRALMADILPATTKVTNPIFWVVVKPSCTPRARQVHQLAVRGCSSENKAQKTGVGSEICDGRCVHGPGQRSRKSESAPPITSTTGQNKLTSYDLHACDGRCVQGRTNARRDSETGPPVQTALTWCRSSPKQCPVRGRSTTGNTSA
jgi:hypothetical protein